MSYGTLNHGDTRQRKINAGGFERIQPEIYCEVHGWFPIWLFGDADGFKKRHAHCDQPRSFEIKTEVVLSEVNLWN